MKKICKCLIAISISFLFMFYSVNAITKTTKKISSFPANLEQVNLWGGNLSFAKNNKGSFVLQRKYNNDYFTMCTTFGFISQSQTVVSCEKITNDWSTDDDLSAGVAAIILYGSGDTNKTLKENIGQNMTEEKYYYTELAINRFLENNGGKYALSYNKWGSLTTNDNKVDKLFKKGNTEYERSKIFKNFKVQLNDFDCNATNCVANVKFKNKPNDVVLSDPIVKVGDSSLSSSEYTYDKITQELQLNADLVNTVGEHIVTIEFTGTRQRYLAQNYNCDVKDKNGKILKKNQRVTPNAVVDGSQTITKSSKNKITYAKKNETSEIYQSVDCSVILYKKSIYDEDIDASGTKLLFKVNNNFNDDGNKFVDMFNAKDENIDFPNVLCFGSSKTEAISFSEIEEQNPPTGYKTDSYVMPSVSSITKEAGKLYIGSIYNAPDNSIIINKLDENGNSLKGATFTFSTAEVETVGFQYVTNDSGQKLLDEQGNFIVTMKNDETGENSWTSDGIHGLKIVELPYKQTFFVKEESAPEGYIVNSPIQSFTLTTDNPNQKLDFVDIMPSVKISKIDNNNNFLGGAKLQLMNSQGGEIETWESKTEPHVVTGLQDGFYYVQEIEAPKGYELNPTPIGFEIKDGKVLGDPINVNKDQTTVEVDVGVYNYPTTVDVPKTFSTKNIIVYLIGTVLIAFGTGVLIYEFKKKKLS